MSSPAMDKTHAPFSASSPPIDARVRLAAAGDRAAARALLESLLPRVRNLVRYLTRGDQQTEDITQDALVALLRGLTGYRGEGTLESWSDRVVARVTFAALRRRRRDPVRQSEDAPDLVLVSDASAQPDEYLARRQAVQMLDRLPLEQRHALVLHHVVGMSIPEIGKELGVSPETIKSRIRLGTARLRELHAVDRARTKDG